MDEEHVDGRIACSRSLRQRASEARRARAVVAAEERRDEQGECGAAGGWVGGARERNHGDSTLLAGINHRVTL